MVNCVYQSNEAEIQQKDTIMKVIFDDVMDNEELEDCLAIALEQLQTGRVSEELTGEAYWIREA